MRKTLCLAAVSALFVGCAEGDRPFLPTSVKRPTEPDKPPLSVTPTSPSRSIPRDQSLPKRTEQTAYSLHELLESAPLPPGYHVSPPNRISSGEIQGEALLISSDHEFGRVAITIEHRDLSDFDYRRTAVKAYVNSTATSMRDYGYGRILEKELPDLGRESTRTPISTRIHAASADGQELWVHLEMFFTDKGFLVMVIADSKEALESLTAWAKTVRPKDAS